MAIFHLSATIHSRGKGHSAVAGAAYRARDAITDERTGERHDYARKSGELLFEGIYAPKDSPTWTRGRAQLWNHVEAFEKRSDAQLARVFTIALPHELTLEQNRRLLQDWVRDNFTRKGLVADVVIHAPDRHGDQRNCHAHVAVVLRKLDGTEFAAKKERTATNDERKAELESQRASWEKLANRHLERAGLDVKIDRRTLKEQGIEAEPTKHLGPTATQMERDGAESERGEANREITQRNAARILAAMCEAEVSQIKAEIIDLKADLAMQEARAAAHGRTDDVRPVFTAAAARTTEPAAEIFDRDAANRATHDRIVEAAIANAEAQKARQQPGPDTGRETRGAPDMPPGADRAAGSPELWDELRAWSGQPARGNERDASAERMAPETLDAIEDVLGAGERTASRGMSAFAAAVEKVLSGVFSFFGLGEPKLTPMQAELAGRANEELADARAVAAAARDKEAATDWRIFEQDRQQQQEDLARDMGYRERPGDRERERARDWP